MCENRDRSCKNTSIIRHRSNTQIAKNIGVSDHTVADVGQKMDSENDEKECPTVQSGQLDRTTGLMADNVLQVHLKHPEWPIIKISKLVGIDQAELSGQLEDFVRLPKTTGNDRKNRPANKKQAESQRQTIQSEIAEHSEKSDRQIAKETGASPTTVGADSEDLQVSRMDTCNM